MILDSNLVGVGCDHSRRPPRCFFPLRLCALTYGLGGAQRVGCWWGRRQRIAARAKHALAMLEYILLLLLFKLQELHVPNVHMLNCFKRILSGAVNQLLCRVSAVRSFARVDKVGPHRGNCLASDFAPHRHNAAEQLPDLRNVLGLFLVLRVIIRKCLLSLVAHRAHLPQFAGPINGGCIGTVIALNEMESISK